MRNAPFPEGKEKKREKKERKKRKKKIEKGKRKKEPKKKGSRYFTITIKLTITAEIYTFCFAAIIFLSGFWGFNTYICSNLYSNLVSFSYMLVNGVRQKKINK